MKIAKLSFIFLSSLLVSQETFPMEQVSHSALKKAQKAGKIALKIGAGTATLGMYALMGTAAMASLGLTLGAAAALPYLYYARYIKPKLAIPAVDLPVAGMEGSEIKAKSGQKQVKKPMVIAQKSNNSSSKNRTSAMAKTAWKAAGMIGVVAVEDDAFSTEYLRQTHATHEQAMQKVNQAAGQLQMQLDDCHAQQIEWHVDYNRTRIAEFPRYEGPYQDMIGVIDGDVQDIVDAARARMHDNLALQWQQSGCKAQQEQLAILARKMQQNSMRLPK